MLPICLVKLISILLNYKVKDNSVQWIELPRDVRGKATNKLYFFGKKKEKEKPGWHYAQYSLRGFFLSFTLHEIEVPSKHSDSDFSFAVEILLTIMSSCSV